MIMKTLLKRAREINCGLAMTLGIVACIVPLSVTAETGEKQIQVQNASKKLAVTMTAKKISFNVGEPIRFEVKGNKTFFLYLFSINEKDNQGVRILPNELDKMNKYPAKRVLTVPNAKIEFVADKPGTEHLVMIASTKYLDLKTDDYKKAGDFLISDAKTVQNQVKAIRVQAAPEKQQADKTEIVVKDITVEIQGEQTAHVKPTKQPIVFVATDRREYKEGETVRIVFGADKKGYVHLYLKQPKNKTVLLKKFEVNGENMYHQDAIAEAPLGEHELIVRYTEDGKDSFEGNSKEKGISLVIDEEPAADNTPQMNYRFVTTN